LVPYGKFTVYLSTLCVDRLFYTEYSHLCKAVVYWHIVFGGLSRICPLRWV
jgi:hypothetical protein